MLMSELARGAGSPARYGFTDGRAEQQLRAAGWWSDTGPDEPSIKVLTALSRAADPDLALRALDRLREADQAGWPQLANALRDSARLRGRLLGVVSVSTALADFLAAGPGEWRRLLGEKGTDASSYHGKLLSSVNARRATGATLTGAEAEQALRIAYRGLLLEIAADDLGHTVEPKLSAPSYVEVTSQLTALAEAALNAGLAVAWTQCDGDGTGQTRLAVIAMGKCGGRELNYVSDVDVIFVGEGDIELATKLARTAMTVVGNSCFEVDAALRPEGKAGALVRTLEGHTAYYRKWARTWEFQALLKARAVAGDTELGARYIEMVDSLVWSAAERENFVADVQQMRRKVEGNVPPGLADRELKLGRGGLRDVEFAVQLLQLVHGRADPELRSRSTVDGLAALGASGYVGRADAAELEISYKFLRTVEHRLQLRRLRRTHLFPEASQKAELRVLARAVGIRPEGDRSAGDVLLSEFRRHAQRVRRLHEKLFYRPLLQAVASVPTDALHLTTKQAANRLAALGYAAPDGALQHIRALTAGVSRRASIQHTLLPVLLDLLADTPDPDGGLLSYRKISEALEDTPWYLRVLRDEGAVVESLAFLLGTSKLVPDLLVRAPEVLQLLGDPARLYGRDPAEVSRSLQAAVRRQQGLKSAVATARSLRRHEMLRVAAADLLGLMDVQAVCQALSSVWGAVLQGTLAAVLSRRQRELGGAPAQIAVIGMGRLGGSELGYGSDADVLFVCEPSEGASDAEAVRFASGVAETVRQLLGAPSADPPLQVDADLRPEGRGGPLVRTLESYRAYYERWGEVWEAQALLRARIVAGDEELGQRFIASVNQIRYPQGGLDAGRARQVRRMKARVQSERIPRGADPTLHTKLGRGGLADVEWTAQLLQLHHAYKVPALRTTSTTGALAALAEAGIVDAPDAAALTEAWLLATRVRNATMLVRGKAADQVPSAGRDLAAVARVLGYSADDDPGKFLDDYRRTTRRAHAVAERVFYE